jgi:ABC-type sugar transport system substrate-binding protein
MMNRNQRLSAMTVALVLGGLMWVSHSHAQGPGSKPFESTYRRPNVSPYMQLQQQGLNPLQNQNIYQTMVQPQVQQQQQQIEQLQQRRQMQQVQAQVANMNSPRGRQLDESIRPTGHASTYMNYSHFYPMGRR